ncbi:proteasome assembly chaperone [Blastocystis sp. subtype 4]|uniref:proteasome assembly chaperone n=1 Tax=Blastocystis sp. subtype 4 TaxID=944170 RepID=UPI0007113750|nr:proteasome assembly chaperone [Blastocystis sp. subtype 4]KNB44441.1 proteasome assembly chaperone [Blastocystis sp. subtype 4]|eukprot:XP_014527877.1 proteasome assembly chaperone [Blastocystis sp. subtype 4]
MKDAPNAFLQVRSQPKDVTGYAEQFVEDLLSLLQSWQVNSIVVFSAADSTFYDSSQMNGTLAYYTTSNSVLDKIQDQVPSINITQEDVNGSGLLPLLQKSLIEASIPFTTFIAFITEGQNFGDAIQYTVWNGCSDSFIMGNGGSIIE